MSIVDGKHCALKSCGTLTFLPIRCALCHVEYCEKHAAAELHECTAALAMEKKRQDCSHETRIRCEKLGCDKPTLQMQQDTNNVTHKAPRCERCRGLFCAAHRSALSHNCRAPRPATPGELRAAAAEERRKRARAILDKNFP